MLVVVFLIIFTTLVLLFNLGIGYIGDFSGYTELARSFIGGRLDLTHTSIQEDYAFYNSKYYLHQGPAPAVLLTPFVFLSDLIGIQFQQSLLHITVFVGAMYLCFKIAKLFKYRTEDSLYFSYAFGLASVYQAISLIPFSSYVSQSVGVFFMLLSIYEFLRKRRYFLIGIYFSFVLATRLTMGLAIIFFVAEILTDKKCRFKQKRNNLVKFFLPFTVTVVTLLLYNYLRFGDWLDNGYSKVPGVPRGISLFELKNIPINFYYYFIRTLGVSFAANQLEVISKLIPRVPFLRVSEPGTSFFVVSPIFLYIFRTNLKNRIARLSLLPIIIVSIVTLAYYSPGWVQVGPRYMIDVLPFIFLLLIHSFKSLRLSVKAKLLILISSFFNFYLFLSTFL